MNDIKARPDMWEQNWRNLNKAKKNLGMDSKQIEIRLPEPCNHWIAQRFCPNQPHCGPFDHNLAGMAGGDLPAGFVEP